MTTYRVNKLTKKGVFEVTTVTVGQAETIGAVLADSKIIRGDALIVRGSGLTVVLAQGQKFLLDEI
jgi:hypothetical protein